MSNPLVFPYAQNLILVKLILVNCLGFSTSLETVFTLYYHIWTQDSPMFPLTVAGETGYYIYIDQGGSKLKV